MTGFNLKSFYVVFWNLNIEFFLFFQSLNVENSATADVNFSGANYSQNYFSETKAN